MTRPVSTALLGLGSDRWLALAGELPPWPRLAVVGSRAAHAGFRAAVPHVLDVMAEAGWSLVSGGAIGVDGDGHRVALNRGVPQLAVLPCGPDLLYPADNADLLRAIPTRARSGLLFALQRGVALRRSVFASRNAIVVGLADAVLVVEAQLRSGSLLTGQLALRSGKPLAVVAGSPGNAALASQGATSIRFDGTDPSGFGADLHAFLRGEPLASRVDPWPPDLRWLREAIVARGRDGLSTDRLDTSVLLALVRAEAAGLVAELTPGRWVVI